MWMIARGLLSLSCICFVFGMPALAGAQELLLQDEEEVLVIGEEPSFSEELGSDTFWLEEQPPQEPFFPEESSPVFEEIVPEEILPVTNGSCGLEATWFFQDQILYVGGAGAMEDYSLLYDPVSGRSFSTAPWDHLKGSIAGVQVADEVSSIGAYAFCDCPLLSFAALGDALRKIGPGAFENCEQLGQVLVPEGVTEIGRNAFTGCKSLSEVGLPPYLSVISWEAFLGCVSLETVDIPDQVWSIESGAFRGCRSLQEVQLNEGLVEIGSNAFSMTGLSCLRIPKSVSMIAGNAFSDAPGLTLEVEAGSAAERFCEEAGLSFVSVGESLPEVTILPTSAQEGPGLSLEPSRLVLFPYGSASDQQGTLKAVAEGVSGKIRFASENKNIAMVDEDGIVYAVQPGETKIISSLVVDGTRYEATCQVVVKPGRIIIPQEEITLKVGRSCGILATALPAGPITYETMDRTIARVNSQGLVRGISAGTTEILIRCNTAEARLKVIVE